jgi:predicted phosphohydrolase
MIIQYISDLHLEFYKKLPYITVKAPILCLTGDIGYPFSNNYNDFLCYVNSLNFIKIFLIAGNHEYYSNVYSMEQINIKINLIIKENNLTKITFLNNSSEEYDNYLFVGSTLWSCVRNTNNLTNDFNMILNITPEIYNKLHDESINYITNIVNTNSNKNIIVLTHYLPSYKLIDKKYIKYNNYYQCFASNNDNLINSPICLWIYGHTHTQNISKINNVTMICNPIGYPNENYETDYNKIIII